MSTVNPGERWWRQDARLRRVVIAAWAVSFAVSAVTGWAGAQYLASGRWVTRARTSYLVGSDGLPESVRRTAEVGSAVFVLPVVAAGALDLYRRARFGGGPGWAVARAFGITLTALGAGGLVAAATAPVAFPGPVLVALAGLLILAAHPVADRLIGRYDDRQAWSRMHGTPAEAVATEVEIRTRADQHRYSVLLKYDDAAGRTRWHRASVLMRESGSDPPKVGARYTVRYDPAHPGRKSSIHVNLTRPKRSRYARRRRPNLP